MRPGSVEVMYIRVEHAVELLLMQDEQMIEAFTPTWITLRDCSSMMKKARQRAKEEVGDREARRMPRSAQHGCVRRCSTSVLVARLGARVSCTSGWCGRQTRRPSLSNSPRRRSAPHSRLFLAICLIKATVSAEILGLAEVALDLYFQ